MAPTSSPVSERNFASPASRTWPEWVGSWPRLIGRQTPEFESKFEGDEETRGDECGVFGARVGMRQMPWQWLVLRATLSLLAVNEWGERLWTHRNVCIECTRQNGKTLIVVLRILYGMFVLREKRIVYTAQRWSTAEDVFDRVIAVIDRIPSLKRRLVAKPTKKDNRGVILLAGGAKYEFGPRSQDFGRGYTEIDLVIFDEAYDLDAVPEKNLTGAQRAAKNPQTWYVSTSPVFTVHPKCQTFSGLHRMGKVHAPSLYYVLFAAPRSLDRRDPDAWPLANPSYGVVGDDREMLATIDKARTITDRLLVDADYLGWAEYAPDEAESTSPIPAKVWEEMANPTAVLVGPRTIALDRTPDRKMWALAAAQRTTTGRIHLEIGRFESSSNAAMVEYLVGLVAEWNPAALVIDAKSGAAELKPLLIEAGIEPEITNSTQMALACGGFLDDALSGALSHCGQPIFDDAVASAIKRDMPGGGFAWNKATAGAIAPLVAATLAHWALLTFGKPVSLPAPPLQATEEHSAGPDREFDPLSAAF